VELGDSIQIRKTITGEFDLEHLAIFSQIDEDQVSMIADRGDSSGYLYCSAQE
jgi:hypothetical protein